MTGRHSYVELFKLHIRNKISYYQTICVWNYDEGKNKNESHTCRPTNGYMLIKYLHMDFIMRK